MKTLARAENKTEIIRRLKSVTPDARRNWGRMSAHQMICHLNDSFLAVTGRRNVSPATGPFQRTVMKWLALYLPLPWPQGIPTRPELDQELEGTPPAEFEKDVAELELLIGIVTSQPACFEGQAHPFFGAMSYSQWMRWAYLHMDHHLRQFGA